MALQHPELYLIDWLIRQTAYYFAVEIVLTSYCSPSVAEQAVAFDVLDAAIVVDDQKNPATIKMQLLVLLMVRYLAHQLSFLGQVVRVFHESFCSNHIHSCCHCCYCECFEGYCQGAFGVLSQARIVFVLVVAKRKRWKLPLAQIPSRVPSL